MKYDFFELRGYLFDPRISWDKYTWQSRNLVMHNLLILYTVIMVLLNLVCKMLISLQILPHGTSFYVLKC